MKTIHHDKRPLNNQLNVQLTQIDRNLKKLNFSLKLMHHQSSWWAAFGMFSLKNNFDIKSCPKEVHKADWWSINSAEKWNRFWILTVGKKLKLIFSAVTAACCLLRGEKSSKWRHVSKYNWYSFPSLWSLSYHFLLLSDFPPLRFRGKY